MSNGLYFHYQKDIKCKKKNNNCSVHFPTSLPLRPIINVVLDPLSTKQCNLTDFVTILSWRKKSFMTDHFSVLS